jgi:CrcB protein
VARFALICLGGAAGTGARFLVATGMLRWLGPTFPFGTLTVNVTGSFLLAIIVELGLTYGAISPDVRVVLATGVMGGFTTYSSFNWEMIALAQEGRLLTAGLYLAATLLGCLAGGLAGMALVHRIVG